MKASKMLVVVAMMMTGFGAHAVNNNDPNYNLALAAITPATSECPLMKTNQKTDRMNIQENVVADASSVQGARASGMTR